MFSYTPIGKYLNPNETFTGVDFFFLYFTDSGGLTSTGEVSICIAKNEELPGWTFYKNFGYYFEGDNWTKVDDEWRFTAKNKWIYSEKLEWIYGQKTKGTF